MLKNMSQLEMIYADKSYRFICDIDSPISNVKEALVKFLQYIGQIEDQIANQKKSEEVNKTIEETKEEKNG